MISSSFLFAQVVRAFLQSCNELSTSGSVEFSTDESCVWKWRCPETVAKKGSVG